MKATRHIAAPLLALIVSAAFILAPVEPVVRGEFRMPLAQVSAQTSGTPSGSGNAGATPATKSGSTSCSGFYSFFTSPFTCIGRTIGALFGALLIGMSAWFLTVVGVLFNWIVEHTIVLFGSSIFSAIKTGVEGAWTAFRDVGNIVIIGMFTFMAISTILGLENFGYKKLLARVLIIAILINFSLLFTTQIINVSNFAATQFYNAMGAQGATANNLPGAAAIAATSNKPPGISGLFMTYMGMSGFADGFTTTWENAEKTDSGLLAFINAAFGSLVLVGAAFVLLYGAFLMISRAVILIFLMLTSALAFASYLIPQLAQSGYGWKTWWTSLLQAAVFGPLIMLFLWATLLVAQSISAAGGSGSLGKLISDPTGGGNIGALFNYLIILGLLFASFKTAHVFSHSIAGFNWAQIASAAPFFLGARFAGLWARSRFGVSGFSTMREKALKKQLDETKMEAANAGTETQRKAAEAKAQRLALQIDRYNKWSKKTFDATGTQIGKNAAKALGMSPLLAGGGKVKSYRDRAEDIAKESAKKAEILALSDAQKKLVREGAAKQGEIAHADNAKLLERISETAKENRQVAQRAADTHPDQVKVSAYKEELKRAEQEKENLRQEYEGFIKGPTTSGQRAQYIRERDEKLSEQDLRIEAAKQEVTALEKEIYKPVQDAEKQVASATRELEVHNRTKGRQVQEFANRAVNKASDRATDSAKEFAGKIAETKFSFSGIGDNYAADQAREAVGKSIKTKRLKEDLAAWRELGKEHGDSGSAGTEKKAADAHE